MEFDWEAFKTENIAVFFDNDEEKTDFLNKCDKKIIKWVTGNEAGYKIPHDDCVIYNSPKIKTKKNFCWLEGLQRASRKFYEEQGYKILNWSDYMRKEFTKDDLKDWMLVVYRNGDKRIITDDVTILRNEYGNIQNYFTTYNDNLLSKENFKKCDIVEVYSTPNDYKVFSFDISKRELLWERKEVKEMTVAEISEALGYDVKIVKEKE